MEQKIRSHSKSNDLHKAEPTAMKISVNFVIDFTGSIGTTANLRDTCNNLRSYTTKHL